uniref:PHD-type domain-containing protein n=1 Tax=Tetradesmus obliquus TaxID=3088 RepID=A0A383VI14_TETOB|eukprot:jgi/Sobl393_1/7572/SZX64452.1
MQRKHTAAAAAAPTTEKEDSGPSVDPNLACRVCHRNQDDDKMLLCSGCVDGYHTYCVGLKPVPAGDWYCADCKPSSSDEQPSDSEPAAAAAAAAAAVSNTSSEYEPTSDGEDASSDWDTDGEPSPKQRGTPSPPVQAGTGQGHTEEEGGSSSEEEEEEDAGCGPRDIFDDLSVLHYIQHNKVDADNLQGDTRTEIKNKMKRIKKRASNYRWDAATGRLLFKASAKYPREREVPPPHQRDALCLEYHEDYGHVGQQRLRGMLLKIYYWRNMSQQIKDNLKGCVSCLRNRALFKLQPELKPR